MAFKHIQERLSALREEFFEHVRAEYQELGVYCEETGNKISLERYKEMRMNSYEQKYLHQYLSDEALIYNLEIALANCFVEMSQYKPPVTYNEYVLTDGIQELLKRYKEKMK